MEQYKYISTKHLEESSGDPSLHDSSFLSLFADILRITVESTFFLRNLLYLIGINNIYIWKETVHLNQTK